MMNSDMTGQTEVTLQKFRHVFDLGPHMEANQNKKDQIPCGSSKKWPAVCSFCMQPARINSNEKGLFTSAILIFFPPVTFGLHCYTKHQ